MHVCVARPQALGAHLLHQRDLLTHCSCDVDGGGKGVIPCASPARRAAAPLLPHLEGRRKETANSKPSHQTSRKAAPPAPSRRSRVTVCARRAAASLLAHLEGRPLVAALQSLAVLRYGIDRTAGEQPKHSDMQVTGPVGLAGIEAGNRALGSVLETGFRRRLDAVCPPLPPPSPVVGSYPPDMSPLYSSHYRYANL